MLFLSCFVMLSACLFVDALWSPAGKRLTSWLSHWYPGSGVVLDCIDSCPLSYFNEYTYLSDFQPT